MESFRPALNLLRGVGDGKGKRISLQAVKRSYCVCILFLVKPEVSRASYDQ